MAPTRQEELTGQLSQGTSQGTQSTGTIPVNAVTSATSGISQNSTLETLRSIEVDLEDMRERLQSISHQRTLLRQEQRATSPQLNYFSHLRTQLEVLANTEFHVRQEEQRLIQERNAIRQSITYSPMQDYQNTVYNSWVNVYGLRSLQSLMGIAPESPVKPHPADNPEKLKKIYENLMVEKVHVDHDKRIIVTTKMICIYKKSWNKWQEKKEAGIYQIRIDFTQQWNRDSSIRIINTTRNKGGQQHPNIDGFICWGTMAIDVERDFNNKDALEVVNDCIDFIQSTRDGHPFNGRYWYHFLRSARLQKQSFIEDPSDIEEITPEL